MILELKHKPITFIATIIWSAGIILNDAIANAAITFIISFKIVSSTGNKKVMIY